MGILQDLGTLNIEFAVAGLDPDASGRSSQERKATRWKPLQGIRHNWWPDYHFFKAWAFSSELIVTN
jgi:hypothetical protein